MGTGGGGAWARDEVRALLNFDASCPQEDGPAEARGLTASSLPLLDSIRLVDLGAIEMKG